MKLARKLCLSVAATAFGVSMIGLSAPAAHAGDSSWGCGGGCRAGNPDDGGSGASDEETP